MGKDQITLEDEVLQNAIMQVRAQRSDFKVCFILKKGTLCFTPSPGRDVFDRLLQFGINTITHSQRMLWSFSEGESDSLGIFSFEAVSDHFMLIVQRLNNTSDHALMFYLFMVVVVVDVIYRLVAKQVLQIFYFNCNVLLLV